MPIILDASGRTTEGTMAAYASQAITRKLQAARNPTDNTVTLASQRAANRRDADGPAANHRRDTVAGRASKRQDKQVASCACVPLCDILPYPPGGTECVPVCGTVPEGCLCRGC